MTAITTRIQITADSDLLMYTSDFAGYSLEDALLGTMSAGEYARLTIERGDDGTEAIAALCELLDHYRDDGSVWFASEYDEASADESHEYTSSLEAFTPRQAHEAIMAQAAREERYAA